MLIIIRGLSGSGKSTLARQFRYEENFFHVEADMFFVHGGRYLFDRSRLHDAHAWCLEQATNALREGRDVVVSNTFCTHAEYQPYIKAAEAFGADYIVMVCRGRWGSVHGVSDEGMQRQRDRWEE